MSMTKTQREAIKQEEQNSTEKKGKRDGKRNCKEAQAEAEKALKEAETKMTVEKTLSNLDKVSKMLDEIHEAAISSPVKTEAPETTPIKETPAPEASEVVTPTPPALTAPTSIKENVPAEEESTRIPFVPLANMLGDYAQAVFNQFKDLLSREAKAQFFTHIEGFPRNGRARLRDSSIVDAVLYKDMIDQLAHQLEAVGAWKNCLYENEKFMGMDGVAVRCNICKKPFQPIYIVGTTTNGKTYERGNFYRYTDGSHGAVCRHCQIVMNKDARAKHEKTEKEREARLKNKFEPTPFRPIRFLTIVRIETINAKEAEWARREDEKAREREEQRDKYNIEKNNALQTIQGDHRNRQEEKSGRKRWNEIEKREREVGKKIAHERRKLESRR